MVVSIATAGVTVKEDKSGKAKLLFGPCAVETVVYKAGKGKSKNVLTVRERAYLPLQLAVSWCLPLTLSYLLIERSLELQCMA